jgi:hypothetical protein
VHFPNIKMINWFDQNKEENASKNNTINWWAALGGCMAMRTAAKLQDCCSAAAQQVGRHTLLTCANLAPHLQVDQQGQEPGGQEGLCGRAAGKGPALHTRHALALQSAQGLHNSFIPALPTQRMPTAPLRCPSNADPQREARRQHEGQQDDHLQVRQRGLLPGGAKGLAALLD